MDEQNIYYSIILRRFYQAFRDVVYRNVPICKYISYQFAGFLAAHWNFGWAKENPSYWEGEVSRLNESEVYDWSDEPYCYDPHPGGIILMRGGFGDIASLYLPRERFFLLSPNQAEVDLIKLNRPDLTAHSIESYYRENLPAVKELSGAIGRLIEEQKDDPILGSPALRHWFIQKIPEIVRVLDAAWSLFESLDIGAVLTISSIYWMDGALNLIAKANRIPSLTLQHGLIIDRNLMAHVPILATKKLVWGQATLDWYKKYGYPESRVSVIGSPRFDMIFERKWCGKEKLCQMLGCDPAQKIMVYATRPTGLPYNIPELVIEGLRPVQEVFLLILLHPGEGSAVDHYLQLTQEYPNCKVARFGHISFYDALSGADFFITYDSTAAIEAMLFKLPVITVESSSACFSYGDLGASIPVTSPAQLTQVVKRLMADEPFKVNAINQYRDFISEYCIPDGRASKRLFDEVEWLCRNGGMA